MQLNHIENGVVLGAGLLSLGRPWPNPCSSVPTDSEARRFLTAAYGAGIRWFDTAGAGYDSFDREGKLVSSEARLGEFLTGLSPAERSGVTVTSKYWELHLIFFLSKGLLLKHFIIHCNGYKYGELFFMQERKGSKELADVRCIKI